MQKFYLAIIVSMLPLGAMGQKEKNHRPDYLSIAYFGEKIFHPGIATSLEWQKRLSREERISIHSLQYGISAAGYLHPRNHIGLQLKPQAGYFITMKKGFEVGALAEVGYMRRFYQGQVFEVKNGDVNRNYLAGQDALVYGGYLHFAYNPTLRKDSKIKWFLQVGAFWEYPFNNGALIHPTVTLGISKRIFK